MNRQVSLSPVSAISAMVAPVVLITVNGVLTSGLLTAYTKVADRMFGLNQERLGIVSALDGGLLHEDKVPTSDRERLDQIRAQMPLIVRHPAHPERGRAVLLLRRSARAQRDRHRSRCHGGLKAVRVRRLGPRAGRDNSGIRRHRHTDRHGREIGRRGPV
jgi:hypothetical protein